MPTPRVEPSMSTMLRIPTNVNSPIPRRVRSKVERHLESLLVSSFSKVFLLHNRLHIVPNMSHSSVNQVFGCHRRHVTKNSPCPPQCRPLKKVLFDTTGFLGAKKLTQEQHDSRQNLYDNRSKEQCFEAICEHITAV